MSTFSEYYPTRFRSVLPQLGGSSKLKKWSCQCSPPINVRVAVAHFHARCLWCRELFRTTETG